jgi:hypothetical protein
MGLSIMFGLMSCVLWLGGIATFGSAKSSMHEILGGVIITTASIMSVGSVLIYQGAKIIRLLGQRENI